MENYLIHDAIRSLYPNVVTIIDTECFDKDNNLINVDMDKVMVEAERLSNIKPVSLEDIIKELSDKVTQQQEQINLLINK